MSVSKWAYSPKKCDGQPCPGDCDFCSLQDEGDEDDEEDDEEDELRYECEFEGDRRGYK